MAENRSRQTAYQIFSIKHRFSGLSCDSLVSRRPAQASVKDGYLPYKWLFYRYWLV